MARNSMNQASKNQSQNREQTQSKNQSQNKTQNKAQNKARTAITVRTARTAAETSTQPTGIKLAFAGCRNTAGRTKCPAPRAPEIFREPADTYELLS